MQSDVRKYGNPRFLKEIAERDIVNSVPNISKEESNRYVPEYGQKAFPIQSTSPAVKPMSRRRKKSKSVSVYVNDAEKALLKSVSSELGLSESGTLKFLLNKFSNKRKKSATHTK